jgi:hypothetical protein
LRNIIIFLSVLFAAFFGYLIGKQDATVKNQNEIISSFVRLQNFHFDQSSKVRLLTHIYEQLESDPSNAKDNILIALMLTYEDDLRLKTGLNEEVGTNNMAIQTNSLLDDFFEKHPISMCVGLPRKELMSCHLKNGI